MNEYELLKNDLSQVTKTKIQYNQILYATVAAILTFAIPREEFYLCLVPYVVIVPLFLAIQVEHKNACKLGTYMIVFLEGKEYNWERRVYEADYGKKRSVGSILIYFGIALTCSIISILKVFATKDVTEIWQYQVSAVIAILTTLVLLFMATQITDYSKTRQKMLAQWKQVYDNEKRFTEQFQRNPEVFLQMVSNLKKETRKQNRFIKLIKTHITRKRRKNEESNSSEQ